MHSAQRPLLPTTTTSTTIEFPAKNNTLTTTPMIATSDNMLASSTTANPIPEQIANESGDDVSTDGLSVSFSINSTDDPDMEVRKSKREALRAKLRGAEKHLLAFTSSSSAGGGSGFLGQMAAVQADLKKVEQEKSNPMDMSTSSG